jgi:4-carboxymuconolactone decarboxylase
MSSPRIRPLEPPFDDTTAALLDKMNPPGAPTLLALFRVLARHPKLMERMMGWGGFLLGRNALLPLRDREVVIDRVCARCSAEYEWGVHVAAFARAAGFDPAQTAAIADANADLAPLTGRDRLLVRLVDELHETADLCDASWSAASAVWTQPQLIELVLLAGWYRAISSLCNAARVPLETWQARWNRLE